MIWNKSGWSGQDQSVHGTLVQECLDQVFYSHESFAKMAEVVVKAGLPQEFSGKWEGCITMSVQGEHI